MILTLILTERSKVAGREKSKSKFWIPLYVLYIIEHRGSELLPSSLALA